MGAFNPETKEARRVLGYLDDAAAARAVREFACLSDRAAMLLLRCRITSGQQVRYLSDRELLSFRTCGPIIFRELRRHFPYEPLRPEHTTRQGRMQRYMRARQRLGMPKKGGKKQG